MPGVIVLKCAECGEITNYKDVYSHGKLHINHTKDCKQRDVDYPRLYLTHQA